MNTYSAFQQRFPLSRKKLWKKVLGKFVTTFIGSLVMSIFFTALLALLAARHSDPSIPLIIAEGIGTFLLFFAIFMGGYVIYVKAYIRRYYYDASDNFLTIKKGVFAPSEIHVQYQKIQDVYVDQDIMDRILHIYDVHIASATVSSGIEAHIDGVDESVVGDLKNFLLGKVQGGSGSSSSAYGPTPATPEAIGPVIFSESISSVRYPINDRWLIGAILGNIISSGGLTLFAAYMLFSRGKRNQGVSAVEIFSMQNSTIILILVGIFLVTFVFRTVWSVLWKSKYYFEFLPQFILLKDGVISREEKHIPYRTIQNVTLRQNFFERLLGMSTVIIENAAGMGGSATSKSGNSTISIPGQPAESGKHLVEQLNIVLSKKFGTGTGL